MVQTRIIKSLVFGTVLIGAGCSPDSVPENAQVDRSVRNVAAVEASSVAQKASNTVQPCSGNWVHVPKASSPTTLYSVSFGVGKVKFQSADFDNSINSFRQIDGKSATAEYLMECRSDGTATLTWIESGRTDRLQAMREADVFRYAKRVGLDLTEDDDMHASDCEGHWLGRGFAVGVSRDDNDAYSIELWHEQPPTPNSGVTVANPLSGPANYEGESDPDKEGTVGTDSVQVTYGNVASLDMRCKGQRAVDSETNALRKVSKSAFSQAVASWPTN